MKKETKKRKLQGIVVSNKMQKTRVVAVTRLTKHPRYHKYYKLTKRYKAHDERNEYNIGDYVVIEETRPLSKEKRWKITGVIRKVESREKQNNGS